jgi:3-oxoacyl-[acyl-carrier-protein] synthase II
MSFNRVAITGIGAICGLGKNISEIWSHAMEGKSGISTIERFPLAESPVTFAGEIKNFKLSDDLMDPKDQDRFDLFNHYGLHAASEALIQAKLTNTTYPDHKIGIILGTGLGGFPHIEMNHKNYIEKGARRVSPFFIPSIIPNMPGGLMSIQFGFRGINFAVASACASSAHALEVAAMEIMLGRQDAVITGGTEAVITPFTIAGFASMKALSKRNSEPSKASRPFDQDRDGFVMGEGAGILVLENYEKAKARGAKILAEVISFGASSDAHHFTAPHPEGAGAITSMIQALEMAQISPSAIGYINAHGTSTPLGDAAETGAIKQVFKDHAYNLHVSSTKSMTGHLLGAAGGLESIFCVKALMEGMLPPTINLDKPDPLCDLNYVPHKPIKKDFEYALNNSFGFGGTNSSTIFKKVV